jgi:pimeloyl-ACP methyl ester carboxylesterase
VGRPRLLLVPSSTELEWRIRPQLEEWAEVAAFDAPGIGSEPAVEAPGPDATVERGLAEVDRRGWERYVVVGDEFGAFNAARLAAARPAAVQAIALGHPALSLRTAGPRAPINGQVHEALVQVLRVDYRSYARALTQVTRGAYDDEAADRYVERVPWELEREYIAAYFKGDPQLELLLAALDVPLLLVEHRDCAMWRPEAFEDIRAAFPHARTGRVDVKPSASPDFAEMLHEFCRDAVAAP